MRYNYMIYKVPVINEKLPILLLNKPEELPSNVLES